MPIKRQWHLTLTKTDSSNVVSINLPIYSGVLLAVFAFILLGGIGLGVYYIAYNQPNVEKMQQISEENKVLREKLQNFSGVIDSLSIRINKIARSKNTDDPQSFLTRDSSMKFTGIGGIPVRMDSVRFSDKSLESTYHTTLFRLQQLKTIVDTDYTSIETREEENSQRRDIFRSTPSIYPAFGRITDPYGVRLHPFTRRYTMHWGIDIANDRGTKIYATADGTVRYAGGKAHYGNVIEIHHDFGYKTVYAHLDGFSVQPGDKVKKGQIIGIMGSTGRSTGNHVHYEVVYIGKNVNPYPYFKSNARDFDLDFGETGSLPDESLSRIKF